jgi:ABC-type nickel/cobalt efflux system permease component RcnA
MLLLGGLIAGCAHVFTGPDHLAALMPIAAVDRGRAARTGAVWGLGHGAGVVVLGLLALLARGAVDVDALSAWSELLVGFLLVAIGLWGVRRGLGMVVHTHPHEHDDAHAHVHVHVGGPHDAEAHRGHTHAAFGVGMLHGAAGAGHVFGVVPALALEAPSAVAWLVAYLIGAVLAMGGFGLVIGTFAHRLGPAGLRGLVITAAVASIVVGVAWIGLALPGQG